jgi:hypothetical protein
MADGWSLPGEPYSGVDRTGRDARRGLGKAMR